MRNLADPTVHATVDELIARLQEQSAHGRGGYEVELVLPSMFTQPHFTPADRFKVGIVHGLPEESGNLVRVVLLPWQYSLNMVVQPSHNKE